MELQKCGKSPGTKWTPAPPTGTVNLKKFLPKHGDRIFTIKGKFKGNFTSHRSYFYAFEENMKSRKACEDTRSGTRNTVAAASVGPRSAVKVKGPKKNQKNVFFKRTKGRALKKAKVLPRKYRVK